MDGRLSSSSICSGMLISLVAAALSGCASSSHKEPSAEARYHRMERDLKRRQSEREVAQVQQIEHRADAVPQQVAPEDLMQPTTDARQTAILAPGAAAPATSLSVRGADQPAQLPAHKAHEASPDPAKIEAPPIEPTSEQRLYSKVLECYRRHNRPEITKATQLLLKTYPDSIYADNALYLSGLLSFEKGDLPKAAEYMNRVLREYPRSNKVVSALFAKAMIEKNQGRLHDARSILSSVRQQYPGSPEAARAVLEIKFIDISAKRREG